MATQPIFLPGKSHGRRILVGSSPWGREEADTTERPHFTSVCEHGCLHYSFKRVIFLKSIFNWRIIALQWWVAFWGTAHASATRVRLGPPPSPQPTLWVITEPGMSSCVTERLPASHLLYGFQGGRESARQAGDAGSIPGLGRCPGAGNGNPLRYSCRGSPVDGGGWRAAVHGVAKSRTRLSAEHRRQPPLLVAARIVICSRLSCPLLRADVVGTAAWVPWRRRNFISRGSGVGGLASRTSVAGSGPSPRGQTSHCAPMGWEGLGSP